jgi:hypothetical protein
MSTFRRYGGLNYSSTNNITRSYISNNEQMNINNYSGQANSKEVFASHVDMSGNSILNVQTIYFQDGTSMSTAPTSGVSSSSSALNLSTVSPQYDTIPSYYSNVVSSTFSQDYNLKPASFKLKTGNEVQTVDYTEIIGILIKEIQELKKEIKELKNK